MIANNLKKDYLVTFRTDKVAYDKINDFYLKSDKVFTSFSACIEYLVLIGLNKQNIK